MRADHITLARVEVHRFGTWHTVAQFNLAAPAAEATVRKGIELLASLDGATTFRLVDVASSTPVANYSFKAGWSLARPAANKLPASATPEAVAEVLAGQMLPVLDAAVPARAQA